MVLTSLEVIFQENLFMETFKDKKPEDIIECWAISFNNGDLKAILDLYNNESVLMPTFLPDILTNKIQIKKAVEKVFSVTVTKVNTLVVPGKYRRFGKTLGYTKSWKKAMLRLKEGDKIELFEGGGS